MGEEFGSEVFNRNLGWIVVEFRASAGIGNSPEVAMENYALLKQSDYVDVGDTFRLKIADPKSDAVRAGLGENGGTENAKTPANPVACGGGVGQAGLEPATKGL